MLQVRPYITFMPRRPFPDAAKLTPDDQAIIGSTRSLGPCFAAGSGG